MSVHHDDSHEDIEDHKGGAYSEPRWEQRQTVSEDGQDRRDLDK
jgi:hypothetical protein